MKKILYILLLIACPLFIQAQVLNSMGSWTPTIDPSQISEAGMDYPNTYNIQSTANQTTIELQRGGGFFATYLSQWRVDVSKNDVQWDNRLRLEIRRTGNGNAQGFWIFSTSITGGTNYIPVGNVSSQFFTGNGIFVNIPIQYRLSGFSVLMPAQNYSTDVVFTLIDL